MKKESLQHTSVPKKHTKQWRNAGAANLKLAHLVMSVDAPPPPPKKKKTKKKKKEVRVRWGCQRWRGGGIF